jgi:hypothetical protein
MRPISIYAAVLAISLAGSVNWTEPPDDRPECWVQLIEAKGVPNLFKVRTRYTEALSPQPKGCQVWLW